MRKIVLSLSALFAFGAANAQNDISVTLNSPTAGSSIGPGMPFTFDMTVTNAGTADVTANDTVVYYPTINGGLLTTTNQSGQTVTVAFIITGTTISTNGMETRGVNFGGLNINGAPAGNIDMCANAFVIGPNWNNVTESDTTNNTDCASIAYDPNGGTVGLAENMVYADIKNIPLLDASYASGSTYFVEAYNVPSSTASLSFVDLTGRTILTQEFEVRNSELKGEVSLSNLPQGVVLAVLSVDGQAVSTKKVVVAQ
ncbi:MAG: hypothetical protein DA405_08455 [Bacteroidetes bacterium]|nr:MAG: hypothetical protein DA405_08455 [Bacteroidota bacterium]